MKSNRIEIRTSDADENIIQLAADKLERITGTKGMKSRTILAAVKEYATSEPEMFFCNRAAIEEVRLSVEYGIDTLNNFMNEFFDVTGISLNYSELQTALFGVNKMDGKVILTESIEQLVSEKKCEEMREKYPDFMFTKDQIKPVDISKLVDLAVNFNFPVVQTKEPGIYWSVYGIENGKIHVIPEQLEKLFIPYRSYAESIIEHEKLTLVKELCRVLNQFLKYSDVSTPQQFTIPYVVEYDVFSNTFKPHSQFVKYTLNFKSF